jgi:uncharacterized membrane protein YphA (DoxX/SURF4 family)
VTQLLLLLILACLLIGGAAVLAGLQWLALGAVLGALLLGAWFMIRASPTAVPNAWISRRTSQPAPKSDLQRFMEACLLFVAAFAALIVALRDLIP